MVFIGELAILIRENKAWNNQEPENLRVPFLGKIMLGTYSSVYLILFNDINGQYLGELLDNSWVSNQFVAMV